MTFYDLEARLVALSDDRQRCWVWSGSKRAWQEGSAILAGKAWAGGSKINAERAERDFAADLDALPT